MKIVKSCIFLLFSFLLFYATARTQQKEEVLLAFNHPAIGYVYVNSYYDYNTNQVFLPLIELFSLLEINFTPDTKNFTLKGNFITPNNPYLINLQSGQINVGNQINIISPDEFRIGETDFYLTPSIFEKIFGLNFTVNILRFTLQLDTKLELPVQERKARERARKRMEQLPGQTDDFPLGYGRNRKILGGAMIDYSLNAVINNQTQNLGYSFTGGAELLGGDLQGNFNGFTDSNGNSVMRTSGLRWRYAVRDNNYFSGLSIGQISTTGLLPFRIKGVAVTNDPIEPRRMYEKYVVDGNTEPESEVEIYINERLTGYQRANELGYYRFDVPVTYGTTRTSLRIYTPAGQIKTIDRQMQVPFTFLPGGVVSYNIQAGRTEYAWTDSLRDQYVEHGNIAYGLNRWLTVLAGAQHIGNDFDADNIFFYSTLSARIAKQYLLSIDAAPDAFYRAAGSVMYPTNLSLNGIYTRFDGEGIFNPRRAKEEISANIYIPLTISETSFGLRLNGEHTRLQSESNTRFQTDLNARIGKANLRLNYRDNIFSSNQTSYSGNGMLTSALTYTISRSPGIPVYVRGMFFRMQARYNIHQNLLQNTELQLSRTIMKTGRLNFDASYEIQTKILYTQIGLTFDLKKVRSTTTINSTNDNVSLQQSLSGNIGIDAPNSHLVLNNRQQVGQAAVAIILFADNNNSGKYDEGDELLPYRGINIDRTATIIVGKDSILRLTQLQSYYKYNLRVNRNAIPDPTLVPLKDQFSFIADPNQYKQIEIPFYRGGIIEGSVLLERSGKQYGQGGLRIIIKGKNSAFEQTVRSFNDGGFYVMYLPQGSYTLEIDKAQLGFLNVKQNEPVEFEIKALADGDYIEGLKIILSGEE